MKSSRAAIDEAKRRLPLPQLMEKLGDGDHAKVNARCPFHEDKSASFSTFQNEQGAWLWKCHSSCGSGDEISFLEKRRGLSKGAAIREFLTLAGVDNGNGTRPSRCEAFDWPECVDAFTKADAGKLADWRGLSLEFVRWLHAQGCVGIHRGNVAFPNHGDGGKVASCHVRLASGKWKFAPKGHRTAPLAFGDTNAADLVLVFESQWDAFAVMDKLGWHHASGLPDTAVLITRGSDNGKLVKGRCAPETVVYAFEQNEPPMPEKKLSPAEKWTADLASAAGCRVLRVATPSPHKDANDWTRAGAMEADIRAAMLAAKIVRADVKTVDLDSTSPEFNKITAGVRGEIVSILTSDGEPGTQRYEVAGLAVKALGRIGRLYFHSERRDFDSALFFNAHTKRLERIRSDAFGAWLSDWLSINRADQLFKFILAAIETAALSGKQTTGILPESFWCARPGAIYLSNGDGQLAKITARTLTLTDNGTDGVLFAAGRTCLPWRMTPPKDIFETCALFRNAKATAGHAPDLLRLWIYSLPSNQRTKPPLCLSGDIGSGKTRLAKGIAEFYGIPAIEQKVEDEGEAHFWPNLDQGGLFTLDNADTKCRWLADTLANAATDGCVQRRKLYTNAETVTLRARAWICVTTANPTFASDSGLADRLLVVRMSRRAEATSDGALSDEIAANRDAGLSFLAETLCRALADTAPTTGGLNSRHPDFATFAIRIGRALRRETEAIAALKTAEADKSLFCLENDPIGAALLAYLKSAQAFSGTAAELAPHLVAIDADLAEQLSAKRLGKRLAVLWPHLQSVLQRAEREQDRQSITRFKFSSAEPAGFAGFGNAIP